jgi:hypothetical protein
MPVTFRRQDKLKFTVLEERIGLAITTGFNRLGEQLITSLQARSPVDRGTYRKGHKKRITGRGLKTTMRVYNSSSHAEWVEKGRKPNSKQPPPAVMLALVKRKGLGARAFSVKTRRAVSAGTIRTTDRKTGKRRTAGQSFLKQQKSIAFLIGRSIAREGIPALRQYLNLKTDEAARISAAITRIRNNIVALANA